MANITITNVDLGNVLLKSSSIGFNSDTLTVPANTTYAEGTILARDSSTQNLVVFVKGGTSNQNGIPKTILSYEVANTTAGSVNTPVRVPVTSKVRKQRLIIHADGDDSNIDKTVEDQLRDYGIDPVDVQDLATLDNQ